MAVNQPRQTFNQRDLYPDIFTKAASLCFLPAMNHAFVDGNKRVGHAAMEVFLILNRYEIVSDVDDQESVMIKVASGKMSRAKFSGWLKNHVRPVI
ncbi:MAG: type II toxin-antitoxin system death-on-curing family toxin [Desulfobacterales bacterium]|nr:type II toxin-antitoxin system death-on-curing family toxin [Desulfobacterales bacterium]